MPKSDDEIQDESGADLEALLGARRSEPAAAAHLLRRHRDGMLRAACRVLGGAAMADVEDAVQEALVSALVTPALPFGDVGAWLRRIAVRKALDLARSRRRRSESELPEPGSSAEPSVPPAAASFVDVATVHAALARLSPTDRALLVLVDLEGLSMAEAAATLGTNRVAAKVRAVRARRRLAALLGAVPRRQG